MYPPSPSPSTRPPIHTSHDGRRRNTKQQPRNATQRTCSPSPRPARWGPHSASAAGLPGSGGAAAAAAGPTPAVGVGVGVGVVWWGAVRGANRRKAARGNRRARHTPDKHTNPTPHSLRQAPHDLDDGPRLGRGGRRGGSSSMPRAAPSVQAIPSWLLPAGWLAGCSLPGLPDFVRVNVWVYGGMDVCECV